MDAQNAVDIAMLKAQVEAMRLRQTHVRDALARASYQVSMELALMRSGVRDTAAGTLNVLEAIGAALDIIARPEPMITDTTSHDGPSPS